jgi:myo-inositol-1(or 4)-monophosphatase
VTRGDSEGPADRDPLTLREAAAEFAREAGALVRAGWGATHAPERKGRIDLVTDFDRRSERLLIARIAERFPGHSVLAEESGAHASGSAPSRVRWLIDPLDGTTNFAHNYPFFAVSVGVEVDGELVAGAVFDPVRGEMFAAARGLGATLDQTAIQVSGIDRLEDALLVTGFPYDVREHPERVMPAFQAFLARAQGIRRDGSAALNLCYVAAGRFDGFWEPALSAWDTAAGTVIVREAGGLVTDYRGGAFRVGASSVLATNRRLHDAMMRVLAESPTHGSRGPEERALPR